MFFLNVSFWCFKRVDLNLCEVKHINYIQNSSNPLNIFSISLFNLLFTKYLWSYISYADLSVGMIF